MREGGKEHVRGKREDGGKERGRKSRKQVKNNWEGNERNRGNKRTLRKE